MTVTSSWTNTPVQPSVDHNRRECKAKSTLRCCLISGYERAPGQGQMRVFAAEQESRYRLQTILCRVLLVQWCSSL